MNRKGPHGNEDKFKAKVLLLFIREFHDTEEIKPPWTRSKLINYFKKAEGIESIDKNVDYHLYDSKNGLITNGILTSMNGYISLNLKSKMLPRVIEILEASEEIGPNVRYLFEKAFLESFFSEYGDVLLNEWRLSSYIIERNKITRELIEKNKWYAREIARRITQNLKGITWYNFPGGDLPDFPVNWNYNAFLLEEGEMAMNKAKEEVDKINLISILSDFAKEVRSNGLDSIFMVSYILKVIEISRMAEEWQGKMFGMRFKDQTPLPFRTIPDFIMAHRTKDEISAYLTKVNHKTTDFFIEKIIDRAINEPPVIDNSLRMDSPVLNLYESFVSEFIQNKREQISKILSGFITLDENQLTEEEKERLEFEKEKLEFERKNWVWF
jgi:hypothetical protein